MTPSTNTHSVCAKPLRADSDRVRPYDLIKPAIDFAFVLVLFTLGLPLMLVGGLLVKLTSRGPILYSQTRVGRFGRPYRIYKIRSMYHNCESAGIRWCAKADPRVTFIGRILRATHIDELPQLWNILRGDMSLVGPRPERPEFVPVLAKSIDGYMDRLAVKPGLTGLAQIQLPADTNLESVRRKLALDLIYVQKRSFWLDMRLIVGTGLYLIGCSYDNVRRLMRLPQIGPAPTLILRDEPLDPHAQIFPQAIADESMPFDSQRTPEMSSV